MLFQRDLCPEKELCNVAIVTQVAQNPIFLGLILRSN